MKYSLLIFSSFFITSLSIASTTARSTDIFTESQKETVVKAIDNICGDTWCEGDYDFKFNQFACNKKSSECELTFQFIERSDDKTVKELNLIKINSKINIKVARRLLQVLNLSNSTL